MGKSKAFMNLGGAMDLIKMSKNPLTPVYEAMTNSLEAIAQKGLRSGSSENEILVTLHFTGLLEDSKELEQIVVEDNGVGFTEENYVRFREFFDKSKGYNNRGTGRLQYFHRFKRIKIDSVFESDGSFHRRVIDCTVGSFIAHEELTPASEQDVMKTQISLCDHSPSDQEKEFFNALSIDDLAAAIANHFMLRFYLDNKKNEFQTPKVKISMLKAGKAIGERIIEPKDIPAPKKEGEIKVPYMTLSHTKDHKPELVLAPGRNEIIKWAHFVLPEKELLKNGIYLCSKDIPVQSVRFDQLKKNENVAGNRYLTAFYGEVLDDAKNVSDSVDSFRFPEKKEIERMSDDMFFNPEDEFLFIDSIEEEVGKAIPGIYEDVIDVRAEKQKEIQAIAKAHGIPVGVIEGAKINISDNEKTITKKLFGAQASQLAEKSFKAKQLFESLRMLDPTAESYQEDIQGKTIELSNLVEDQNKEELSRYVIRREMVTEILRKILSSELEYQNVPPVKGKKKNREGLIHDLIFKRKSSATHTLNDLWILNEEFMHFDGCSELELDQIKTAQGEPLLQTIPEETVKSLKLKIKRRPDIFLFSDEEKCLMVELKAPDEDLADHLNQMTKYCNIIANFGVKKYTNFFCYLIGENINPVTDLDGDYKKTVNGDWIKPNISIVSMDTNRNVIANAQIEVIKLSAIHARAHRRNLSFADKIGIRDLLNLADEQMTAIPD